MIALLIFILLAVVLFGALGAAVAHPLFIVAGALLLLLLVVALRGGGIP